MPDPSPEPSHTRQMLGSLVAALLLVGAVIAIATARIAPQGVGDPDDREDHAEDVEDADHRSGGGHGRGRSGRD